MNDPSIQTYRSAGYLPSTGEAPSDVDPCLTPLPEGIQKRIAMLGDPGSGKTTLAMALRSALHELDPGHYPHLVSANPDGQGQGEWYQQTAARDPEFATTLRDLAEGAFSPRFAQRVFTEIENDRFSPVVLVDVGGSADTDNQAIAAQCTHAIILLQDERDQARWDTFIDGVNSIRSEAGLSPIRVYAKLLSTSSSVDSALTTGVDDTLTGTAQRLKATEPCHGHAIVQELAQRLIGQYLDKLPPAVHHEGLFSLEVLPRHTSAGEMSPVHIKVGINHSLSDNKALLREALYKLDSILPALPKGRVVLLNGPMTMPIAVGFASRLDDGTRVLAYYARDVGNYVVVATPHDESSYQVGDLIDGEGSLLRRNGTQRGHTLSNICITAVTAPGAATDSFLVEASLPDELANSPELCLAAAEEIQLGCHRERSEPRGTLYLNCKMPRAIAEGIALQLNRYFERVAICLPDEPSDRNYLVMKPSSSQPSEARIGTPIPVPAIAELTSRSASSKVGDRVIDGQLTTFALDPSNPIPSDRLVSEAMSKYKSLTPTGGAHFLNGKGPLVLAAALAVRAHQPGSHNIIGVFAPPMPPDEAYLVSAGPPDMVGQGIPHPIPKEALVPESLTERIERLAHEGRLAQTITDKAEIAFLHVGLQNGRALSRTIAGRYDRSSSTAKPIITLAGERLAEQATDGLLVALHRVWETAKRQELSASSLCDLIAELYHDTHHSILDDTQIKYRTWDLPYTRINDPKAIELSMDTFLKTLESILDKSYNANVKTAALVSYGIDHVIHPFVDGVGRMSLLLALLVHARHHLPLPQFSDRSQHYAAINTSRDAFVNYYHQACTVA